MIWGTALAFFIRISISLSSCRLYLSQGRWFQFSLINHFKRQLLGFLTIYHIFSFWCLEIHLAPLAFFGDNISQCLQAFNNIGYQNYDVRVNFYIAIKRFLEDVFGLHCSLPRLVSLSEGYFVHLDVCWKIWTVLLWPVLLNTFST